MRTLSWVLLENVEAIGFIPLEFIPLGFIPLAFKFNPDNTNHSCFMAPTNLQIESQVSSKRREPERSDVWMFPPSCFGTTFKDAVAENREISRMKFKNNFIFESSSNLTVCNFIQKLPK